MRCKNKRENKHCNTCCDKCNQWQSSWQTQCGGYQAYCINPIRGFTVYTAKCSCNPYLGEYEMIYLKYKTHHSQNSHSCQCQKRDEFKYRKWFISLLNTFYSKY